MNASLPFKGKRRLSGKTLQLCLLLIIGTSIIASCPIATGQSSLNSYNYKFTVDENGFTLVDITFQSSESTGSSWVFLPKFSPWNNVTLSGRITSSNLAKTQNYVGEDYYFYQVYEFFFVSESSFQMKIQFNMTEGALIIEPRGIFFSPQIGFHPDSIDNAEAEVIFPSGFKVKDEYVASSSGSTYTVPSPNRVLFDLQDNLDRLQIEFETAAAEPTWKQLNQGVFRFRTVNRYESYASETLALFDSVYDDFTTLFNVTLEDIDVQFFIPDFETFLSIGGYVPFTGQTLGEININIFFVRAVNGTIQSFALHELIHHFLWKAGLSPDYFLWFHEGTAQFVSVETVDNLGYPGGETEKDRMEQGASQYVSQFGEDFGFLEEWTPAKEPFDIGRNYATSYYIVSKLAEEYGGLDFYKRFFEVIHGLEFEPGEWKPNEWLAFYLSMAANASVDLKLKLWGFNIRLLYTGLKISPDLILEAEKAVDGLSPLFLPYNLIAKFFYQQALLRLERGDIDGANQLLEATITLANLAPLLTLLTIGTLFAIIIYILHRRSLKPSAQLPPLPPTPEELNT